MIITKTPFRVSFVGGGSDLPDFYRAHGGQVVSTTINKYVYVTVNRLSDCFDCNYLLKYSKTEKCVDLDDIKHPIIREVLRRFNVKDKLEITSMADLPAGTGLGSSSSFTVGLLNALYAYHGKFVLKEQLAREACEIEIDILKEPIGKQDQYAAAYGGFNTIHFDTDDSVRVSPVVCTPKSLSLLRNSLLLFYTRMTRKASDVLSDQKLRTQKSQETRSSLSSMVSQCNKFLDALSENVMSIGTLLHNSWMSKKSLSPYITSKEIDDIYSSAIDAGASGGKLLGAGGGGCILLFVDQNSQDQVRRSLLPYRLVEVVFEFENEGSQVIFASH